MSHAYVCDACGEVFSENSNHWSRITGQINTHHEFVQTYDFHLCGNCNPVTIEELLKRIKTKDVFTPRPRLTKPRKSKPVPRLEQ